MICDFSKNQLGYQWIDITDPSGEELQRIAGEYALHPASVNDCLQPDHLPKYERFKGYTFIIFRFYFAESDLEADSVQELTNKIAVFISGDFILTIHRREWPPLEHIRKVRVDTGECTTPFEVLTEMVTAGLLSFEEPGARLTRYIEWYEKQVFLRRRKTEMLKGLYFVKRKIDVIRRLLLLSYEIVDKIDTREKDSAYTRDMRDLYTRQQSLFDSLAENTNHLLGIYFNISSQRTNETIRVLTIFSVFFMPLTFIVGVYGMNFKWMPELEWKWGYPGVFVLMILVTLCIYSWFRKKGWL